MDILDRMIDHDAWTIRLVLERCSELRVEQWHQPFDIGHTTIHATLGHILSNIEEWTDLMYERAVRSNTMPDAGPDLVPVWQARFAVASSDFAALARSRAAAGLLDATYLDVLDKPPQRKTFGGTIAHVLMHSMIHRAEVLHMLARLGVDALPEGDVMTWEQKTQGIVQERSASNDDN